MHAPPHSHAQLTKIRKEDERGRKKRKKVRRRRGRGGGRCIWGNRAHRCTTVEAARTRIVVRWQCSWRRTRAPIWSSAHRPIPRTRASNCAPAVVSNVLPSVTKNDTTHRHTQVDRQKESRESREREREREMTRERERWGSPLIKPQTALSRKAFAWSTPIHTRARVVACRW